jgi:hypothetical protein
MKPIRQKRDEIVELVRRRGKAMQQGDGRPRRIPSLSIEDPKACNIRGLKIHKRFFLTAPAMTDAGGEEAGGCGCGGKCGASGREGRTSRHSQLPS